LYGRSRPNNSATGRFDLSQLIRQRLLGGLAREVLERAEQGAAVRKNGAARLLLAALKPLSKRRRPRPDARPLFRIRRQAEAGTAQGHLFSFGTMGALSSSTALAPPYLFGRSCQGLVSAVGLLRGRPALSGSAVTLGGVVAT
jgi:hypothetical protein